MTQKQREIINETIGIMIALGAAAEGDLADLMISEAEILQEMLDNDKSGT